MKKIVNYLLLVVICLLPVIVEAKAEIELNSEFVHEAFLYEEDGESYFFNGLLNIDDEDNLKIYDLDNTFKELSSLMNEDAETAVEYYKYKPFLEFIRNMYISDKTGLLFEEGNVFNIIDFYNGSINVLDLETVESEEILFEDDVDTVKKYLGKGYDIYLGLVNAGVKVELIREIDGYFVVDYYDENNWEYYTAIVDSNLEIIVDFVRDYNSYQAVHIHDGLIYAMKDNKTLEIYKLDGTKIQTYNIVSSNVETPESTICNYIGPQYLKIVNNRLYIVYNDSRFQCEERYNYNDASDYVKQAIIYDGFLTLKYLLDFDVEKVESNNGEFTYETKEDEDGKSYVELKITPKEGYSVEEIIVTDVNGNRIEVTDNKFYKPMNDVKVEVKYVYGEYLPIPDTFLGKSLTLIIIGLVLVGLGFYTINYVKGESKVEV